MHSTAWRDAVRRSMLVIGLAGGFTVLGAGIAASTATADEQAPVVGVAAAGHAAADDENDENDETSGESGTGSGNQVEADVEAPVDATDNQVTVIGDGNQSQGGGSEPENGVEPDADVDHTSGEDGTLSGNQVDAEVEAPVELTGNQVTVIGDENDSEGSTAGSCEDGGASSGDTTNGDDGLLSGNQVDVEADAPVDASGNQVTVVGDENTSGGTSDGGCGTAGGSDGSDSDGASAPEGGDTTSGEDGVGSSNQLTLDPDAPVDASGNQVTVIGDDNQSGGSTGGVGSTDGAAGGGDTTSGEDGVGSGNQLTLDPDLPVDVSGNQVTVIGDGNQSGGATGGADDGEAGDPD
ncbi:MAG TPA: chaplin family protein, partial [Nocardioidaceae bacterium]|nr:chaplin family protein [Nocardioidaceae bacterium]